MGVRLVDEQVIEDKPAQVTPNFAPVLNAIRLGIGVLNARAMLLASLVGAFWIWNLTVASPDPWRIAAASLYSLGTVLPMVWLAVVKG